MLYLAFYCGTGSALDWLIRCATRSAVSHVELLCLTAAPDPCRAFDARALSSSAWDGGVRSKHIRFEPGHWIYVAVPWSRPDAAVRIEAYLGARYDFVGILLSQVLNLHREQASTWFCSEICAYAIGLEDGASYSPGALLRVVRKINGVKFGTDMVFGERARGSRRIFS